MSKNLERRGLGLGNHYPKNMLSPPHPKRDEGAVPLWFVDKPRISRPSRPFFFGGLWVLQKMGMVDGMVEIFHDNDLGNDLGRFNK